MQPIGIALVEPGIMPVRRLLLIAIICITPSPACAVGLPAGTILHITATASYESEAGEMVTVEAETTLIVPQYAGSAIEGNGTAGATVAGADSYIPLKVINTGNGLDWFALSARSTNGWQVSLVHDDNADGVHQTSENESITDTGLMVGGGFYACFARVRVPDGAQVGDLVTVNARSGLDSDTGSSEARFTLAAPPTPAVLSVSASPASVYVGQTVSLAGTIAPAMACTLTVSVASPAGAVTTRQVTTSAGDGSFVHPLTVQEAGQYAVEVTFAGDSQYAGCSAECSVQSDPKIVTSITCGSSPSAPIEGDRVTISGALTPHCEAELHLTCTSPGGSVIHANLTTDASGNYSWEHVVDTAGDWHVVVRYAGSESREPADVATAFHVTAHEVRFTDGPTVSPARVESGGSTECGATATDSCGHGVTYEWSDGGANGTFGPSATVRNPTYAAPANKTGHDLHVTLTCTATCDQSADVHCSGSMVLTVESVPSPTCTVTGPAQPTNLSPILFAISFSQAVTGLGVAAVIVEGGRASNLSGTGSSYTLSVVPDGEGVVSCTVPAGAAHNADGLGNTKSNTATAIFDSMPPEVYITHPTTDPTCVRVGACLALSGTASADTTSLAWENETTGASGSCVGAEAWSVEGIPLQIGDNVICVTATDLGGQSGTARITATRLDVDENALNDAWRGYAMVSAPVIPDTVDPELVFGFQDRKWCTYLSVPGRYVFYPDPYTFLDPPEATPGRGFCAVFDSPAEVPCGTVLPQDQPVTIHLYPGWNLFGQPFLTTVNWELDKIMIHYPTGAMGTLEESELVMPNAWGWQQDEHNIRTGAYYRIGDPALDPDAAHDLPPWRAFWICSRVECDLILPPPGLDAPRSPGRRRAAPGAYPSRLGCVPMPPPPPR